MDKPERTNILLVDDRRERLLALRTVLEPLEQNLVCVSSGDEALRELLRREFSVILLDVHMPGMDGFETAQFIRERPRSSHTPIIFVTGSQEWDDMQRAYHLGAVDFISVPLVPHMLRAKVSVFVDLFQAAQQAHAEAEGRAREEEARRQAEAESRAKDEFLATVSHELRTPLTPILATIQTLEQDADPATLRSGLHMMRRNIEMEARLIDDLLDLTRIQTGKLHLRMELIDIQNALKRAVEICRSKAEEKSVHLSLQVRAKQRTVWADPARLQQVFWNLISNAVKFTPADGRVTVRVTNPTDEQVQIDVVDTGIGIDPRDLSRVFKRFLQLGRGLAPEGGAGGLGLGLAISKSIVEAHQGEISASSLGAGKGTTLTTIFPLKEGQVKEGDDDQKHGTPPAPAPLRILVVDDHQDTREALQRLLARKGYSVETAADVRSGLEAACAGHFDLLISDIGLPDGSGVDLMRKVKEECPMPGIALSGFGMQQDIERSREAGFIEHLTKPVSFTELQAVIARHRSDLRDLQEAGGQRNGDG